MADAPRAVRRRRGAAASGPRSASASSARRCRCSARSTSPADRPGPRPAARDGAAARRRPLGRRGGGRLVDPGRGRLGRGGLLARRSSMRCRRRPAAAALLARLAARYRLAILSNWPLAVTIDRYAEAAGWTPHLAAIVVLAAGRDDQAAPGDLRRGPDGARRSRRPRRSSTSATTGRRTSSGAKRAGWRAAYLRAGPRDSPLPGERARGDDRAATLRARARSRPRAGRDARRRPATAGGSTGAGRR